MSETINLKVNGIHHSISCTGRESLLELLRDCLELTGAKEGCGYGVCGSCTVVVDGEAVTACTLRGKKKLEGIEVLTIEGLAPDGELHLLQAAFLETGAVQCGFCTPGIILRLHALFTKNPNASRDEVEEALSHHLCRCTGYEAIWNAALFGQKMMGKKKGDLYR